MKRYLVTLRPENNIPEEGCDSFLEDIHLWVLAEDREEAGKMAVKIMKKHKLYCRVGLVRGGSGSNPKFLAEYAKNKAAERERRMTK